MKKVLKIMPICMFVFIIFGADLSSAGPYGNDLSKCLVESTTKSDKVILMQWCFAMYALHPAVEPLTSVSDEDREALNRKVADIFTKLITNTCTKEMQKAYEYEGQAAIQTSFQTLGMIAAQELMQNEKVSESFTGFLKYVDKEKFNNLFE